jgi:hypothetical protein
MKRGKHKEQPKSSAPADPPKESPAPLRPRPKLFLTLFVIFLVWLGVLLAMYFKTVYPHRSQTSTGAEAGARPGASGRPSAPR